MRKIISIPVLLFFTLLTIGVLLICGEKVTYLSVEHPAVTYRNPKFLSYAKLSSRRFGRRNPVYYVDLKYTTLVPLTNSIKVDFYFFEFLTNQYKRSFVEMHFLLCDLFNKDPFFGAAMKRAAAGKPCPGPPGSYDLANMTVSPKAIPRGFPFTKGRIYANLTYGTKNEPFANGYIDMEIRQIKVNDKNVTDIF